MKISKEQYRMMEQELLNELPIKVNGNVITYNNYIIKQDKQGYWDLYANFNGLDLVNKFYLRISAVMAAKQYEKCKMQEFNSILSMDSHYSKLHNDILHFRHQMKKTSDTVKKDNYLFRLQECYLKLTNIKQEIEKMYRASF
jgi:hypothetical protein